MRTSEIYLRTTSSLSTQRLQVYGRRLGQGRLDTSIAGFLGRPFVIAGHCLELVTRRAQRPARSLTFLTIQSFYRLFKPDNWGP